MTSRMSLSMGLWGISSSTLFWYLRICCRALCGAWGRRSGREGQGPAGGGGKGGKLGMHAWGCRRTSCKHGVSGPLATHHARPPTPLHRLAVGIRHLACGLVGARGLGLGGQQHPARGWAWLGRGWGRGWCRGWCRGSQALALQVLRGSGRVGTVGTGAQQDPVLRAAGLSTPGRERPERGIPEA